jgi:signal transduction histidine kinase
LESVREGSSSERGQSGGGKLRWLLTMLGLVVLLFATGRLAMVAANPTGFSSVSAVWPPAGLAMAVLLHYGRRGWIVAFTAALAINLSSAPPEVLLREPTATLLSSMALSLSSTLATVGGAMAIRRATGAPVALLDNRHILAFALYGGLLTPALAALGGASLLVLLGKLPVATFAFTWLTWFVGDSIGVLIFAPVFLTLVRHDEPLWRQRRRAVALPLLLAFVLIIGFFVYNRARYEAQQARMLGELAERMSRSLSADLHGEIELLHVLAETYGVRDGDDERLFQALAGHRLAESQVLAAATWLPEPDTAAGVHRAMWVAARPSHVLTPSTALSADDEIPRALARARAVGTLAATGPRPRLLGQGDTPVLWVFAPVPLSASAPAPPGSPPAGRAPPVRGYFGVALSVDALLAPLRGQAQRAHIEVWLEDPTAPASAAPLAVVERVAPAAAMPAKMSEKARSLMATRALQVADRAWYMRVAPTETFLSGADSLALWFTMAASLAFTGVLGMFLLGFSGRHAVIEAQVAERTTALTQAKLHLEREVAEREQAQASLARAVEKAEGASRAKSRFLNTVSHEIRTPMNGVLGMAQLLSFTQLDGEQRDYVDVLRDAGAALLVLVNDMLDMARIESGRMWLDEAPFALRPTVQAVHALLGPRAQSQSLTLHVAVREDVPDALLGDAHRLRQVLVNLVGNAIKFTDQGSVVVEVVVQSRDDAAVELCFRVADTGIGIAEDKRDIIFHAFEQGDASLARRYGGTGLGLAIAAELVQLMGGRIWVDSELGKGSVFSFTARFRLASA